MAIANETLVYVTSRAELERSGRVTANAGGERDRAGPVGRQHLRGQQSLPAHGLSA